MNDKPADAIAPNDNHEHTRTGHSVAALKRAFLDNLFYIQGRYLDVATPSDLYTALAYTVRDRLLHRFNQSSKTFKHSASRTVCLFSAEYLPGPHLGNNMMNLDIMENVRAMLRELGLEFDRLLEEEQEPGLGSGGLGRLAACFLDSLATLQIPAIGYGIRYEHGMFNQEIVDGVQVETTDKWLHAGNPWEIRRPKLVMPVGFGGSTRREGSGSNAVVHWEPAEYVNGVAFDTPVPGYRVNNVNLLRLWRAEAPESFDVQAFNAGDYYRAVDRKIASENLSKVLYPNDVPEAGKVLRLKQQYFFVACSLRDMLRIYLDTTATGLDHFHEKFVIQLNDTHPAIAVVELLRLLVDDHGMPWAKAWSVTRHTFRYTNHTLMPEALEKWPVRLFEKLLPRHLELIYTINDWFLDEVRLRFHGDNEKIARLSLIEHDGETYVRMANLACAGSRHINGVARLHTELLKSEVLRDFHDLWPERIINVTNGVTPRRFLQLNNPALASLIGEAVGGEWSHDLERLRRLEERVDDPGFQDSWRRVKQANKQRLAHCLGRRADITIDPDTLFDIQVKRIHEYKRQHLNLLHVITLYNRIRNDPHYTAVPRTFIFGGKASPGYAMAKLMIRLINAVAAMVNRDPACKDLLRVVFFPNFNVKHSSWIYPAADLSEQISLAGMEASGTGNMKFAMNGALTIGTLDGANVEIRDAVGHDNFFLFGMNADEVRGLRLSGYRPREYVERNPELGAALELIQTGYFSRGDRELYRPLVDTLLNRDPFMLIADYAAYVSCQEGVNEIYRDAAAWTRRAITNVARIGPFSSDRAVREYCDRIWQIGPVPVMAATID